MSQRRYSSYLKVLLIILYYGVIAGRSTTSPPHELKGIGNLQYSCEGRQFLRGLEKASQRQTSEAFTCHPGIRMPLIYMSTEVDWDK